MSIYPPKLKKYLFSLFILPSGCEVSSNDHDDDSDDKIVDLLITAYWSFQQNKMGHNQTQQMLLPIIEII